MEAAHSLDWSQFTDDAKPWDPDRPFHRIHCPTRDKTGAKPGPNAKGTKCGCRVPEDFGPSVKWQEDVAALFGDDARKAGRTVPGWVDVPEANGVTQEIEGMLVRSFQTWTDAPLYQWHRWYDWNFMIFAEPGSRYLLGKQNKAPDPSKDFSEDPKTNAELQGQGWRWVVRDFDFTNIPVMECEFDCGLFGARFRPDFPPQTFGPMFDQDLAWPTAGFYFWGMGRWIYDCGHPAGSELLTRSELHPCHALATARWEAFQFEENAPYYTPAIQFTFFATTVGGYTDPEQQPKFPSKNLEFIVDLPKVEMHRGPFPIGHTPGTPHNTIHLPKLLKHVEFKKFSQAFSRTPGDGDKTILYQKAKGAEIEPIVEPIRNKEFPDRPPEQVKVTIPFAAGLPAGTSYYGFTLSLGWLDHDLSQARKVKQVTVKFQRVVAGNNKHDKVTSGEWQVRASVNGRWTGKRQSSVTTNTVIPLGASFTVFLTDDQYLYFGCHGEETDLVHDIYKDRTDNNRILRIEPEGPDGEFGDSRPVRYFEDCRFSNFTRSREVLNAILDEMWKTFNDQSDPLGIIDPFHSSGDSGDTKNPLKVGDIPVGTDTGKDGVNVVLTARPCKELGDLAELLDLPNGVDYRLFCKVNAIPQIKDI